VSLEQDISFARAMEIVRAQALVGDTEPVGLADAVGRTLAADVTARADHPPFDNSAMDGWALRASDASAPLQVLGESAAGAPYPHPLAPGAAVVISTGAPLPAGADAVVPREDAAQQDDVLEVAGPVAPGAFVRRRGEDVRRGDRVLPQGLRIAPHHLAVAAGTGHPELPCCSRPKVALIVSGQELIPIGAAPRPGQVWDIAGAVMPALIRAAGGAVVAAQTVPDDADATADALAGAIAVADLVVTTGGVSVGRHDHIRAALARLDATGLLWGVRIRPGHPMWFGRHGATRILALPGNPVASVVCFVVFGRVLMGGDDPWITLPLAEDYRSTTPRTDLIRCALGPDGLVPHLRQASHHVTSLQAATHIAMVPEGAGGLRKGDRVEAVALSG
jgi:molybdopterin molybdotransferase